MITWININKDDPSIHHLKVLKPFGGHGAAEDTQLLLGKGGAHPKQVVSQLQGKIKRINW